MYKTLQGTREAIKKVIDNCRYKNLTFVITESKISKSSSFIGYGFRCLINEEFSSEWQRDHYGHYHRMIETVKC